MTITDKPNPNAMLGQTRMFEDILGARDQQRRDLRSFGGVGSLAIRQIDAPVSSLLNVATLGWAGDSLVPDSYDRYHRLKGAGDVLGAIPQLIAGVGLATQAVRGASIGAGALRTREGITPAWSRMREVERIEGLAGDANAAYQVSIASRMFENAGQMPSNAAVGGALAQMTGARTMGDVRSFTQRQRLKDGIVEGLAQEAGVLALMNQNTLLFPEDVSAKDLLMMGGIAVGLNTVINYAVGRASWRKLYNRAGVEGAEAAKVAAATYGALRYGDTSGTRQIGDQWLFGLSATFHRDRLDAMAMQVDQMVAESGGLVPREVFEEAIQRSRANAEGLHHIATSHMATNSIADATLRETRVIGGQTGLELSPARTKELSERVMGNVHTQAGLAQYADTGVATRWNAALDRVADERQQQLAALAKAAPEDVKRIENRLDQLEDTTRRLEEFRPGVVERTGVVNPNEHRRKMPSERPGGTQVKGYQQGQLELQATHDQRRVQIATQDEAHPLRIVDDKGIARPVKDAELNFDELMDTYTMVGQSLSGQKASAPAVRDFWNTFMQGQNWDTLPIAVLDAIRLGKMRLPEEMSGHPGAAKLMNMINSGGLNNISLAKKAEWMRAQKLREAQQRGFSGPEMPMDHFDYEKALNLRLTDDFGRPNALYKGLEAMATARKGASQEYAVADLHGALVTARPNDGTDALLDMGLGAMDLLEPGARDLHESAFSAALRHADSLEAHEGLGAVGTLHRNMDLPNDSEQQLAIHAALQAENRRRLLTDGPSEYFNAFGRALQEQEILVNTAKQVGALADGAITGAATVTQQSFRARNSKALQATATLGSQMEKIKDAVVAERIAPLLREVKRMFTKEPQRFAQMSAQFSNAHHFVSRGTALVDEAYQVGRNEIDLSRPGAQNMLRNLEALNEGRPLRDWPAQGEPVHMFDMVEAVKNGRYVPLELSDDAASMLNRYAEVSFEQWQAMNVARQLQGKTPMPRLNGHVPTLDANRYEYRYLKDPLTGETVAFVRGKTGPEVEQLTKETIARMGDHYVVMDQQTMKAQANVYDEVFQMNMQDWTGIKQTGTASGKGADFRLDVSGDLFEEMGVSMRNTYGDLKNRAVAANFSDAYAQLDQMQGQGQFGSWQAKSGKLSNEQARNTRHWDGAELWQRMLMADTRMPEGSTVGKLHNTFQQWSNEVLGRAAPHVDSGFRAMHKMFTGQELTKHERNLAEGFQKAYKPFNALVDNAQLREYAKISQSADPYKVERTLQQLNQASTALFLKLANLSHPILNYTGIVSTTSAVVRSVQRRPNESTRDWEDRVGLFADFLDPASDIATVSPHKLAAEGWHLMYNDPAAVRYAVKHGYADANMMEEVNRLSSLQPTSWDDVGDKFMSWTDFINTPYKKAFGRPGEKMGIGSDTISEYTEKHTRLWAHMMGVALARRSGKTGLTEAQAHSFGHYLSNQQIADFSPHLRGDAWRGTAGIPFGLFQSYGINILQRMFRYIENKDHRALVTQAVMQGLIHGANGIPGWPMLNEQVSNLKDHRSETGATSLNERIHMHLGKGAADVIMNGTVSNIPRLFGADSGVNLYTSGDINPRINLQQPPSLGMLSNFAAGGYELGRRVIEELEAFADPELSVSKGRLAEVLANYAPSRGQRALTELVLGERVDRRGNLIVDDTRSGVELVARLLTTRTSNELQTADAIWKNSQAARQRQQDMVRVRQRMLRHLRNGDMSEGEMHAWFERYLRDGGREDQWDRWLKFTMDVAGDTRADRALASFVNRHGEVFGHNEASVHRLLGAGADIKLAEGKFNENVE